MKADIRYIRKYLCIAVALFCSLACHADVANTTHKAQEVSCTSCYEEDSATPYSMHKTEQWATPSTSGSIQGTTGRTPILSKTLQRTSRLYSMLQAIGTEQAQTTAEAQRKALSTKRFQSGYYIYYRCQMRC